MNNKVHVIVLLNLRLHSLSSLLFGDNNIDKITMVYFITDINPGLAKQPFKNSGGVAKLLSKNGHKMFRLIEKKYNEIRFRTSSSVRSKGPQ